MEMNEKYPGINIDEKEFKRKVRCFNKLVSDLRRAVDKYHRTEPTRFGACLMSKSDLEEWQLINEVDKTVFFQKLDNFWNFSIAMTDGLALIPLEDVR